MVSFSIISTPALESKFIASSHLDRTSSSTVEKPIVGDHIAVLGTSLIKSSDQFKLSDSKEKISVGSGPTVASRAKALS